MKISTVELSKPLNGTLENSMVEIDPRDEEFKARYELLRQQYLMLKYEYDQLKSLHSRTIFRLAYSFRAFLLTHFRPLVDLFVRNKSTLLESPRTSTNFRIAPSQQKDLKVAVILHLYYVEIWEEILQNLQKIPYQVDLYVSLPHKNSSFEPEILRHYPSASIHYFENQGRDVGPFLEIARAIDFSKYSMFCKIHSKRSPHRRDGDQWRKIIYHSLLGSEFKIRRISDMILNQAFGIVGCEEHLNYHHLGPNKKNVKKILKSIPKATWKDFGFIEGTMFWGSMEVLKSFSQLPYGIQHFKAGHTETDGELEHALERAAGFLCKQSNQKLGGISFLEEEDF